jgi:hypothetical protein
LSGELKMPKQDGTGPSGQGAMTGRGLGPCGRGLARGFGRGMGWRCLGRFPYAEPVTLTKKEEKKVLEAELEEIEAEKREIEKRLKDAKA